MYFNWNKIQDKVYLIIFLIFVFSIIHYYLSQRDPNNYNQKIDYFDALYFSVVSQSSTGYGDIYATSKLTKLIVSGQLLLVVFIALH